MGFDLRRCAEAAVHAALAEAFARPEPNRASRARRRRWRPIRAVFRAIRAFLLVVGLLTVAHAARNPKLRAEVLEALAARFPIEEFLEEIAGEMEAARAAVSGQPGAAEQEPDTPDEEPATEASNQRRRRPPARRRGDSNGQRGRKPPDRGTHAA